ncbi:hypothetical protein BDF21DRAFT_490824 [Thamnidium elegans]|nr:hypothetical protein BDF21DRAFT_490824 [Thamnidium elegans]
MAPNTQEADLIQASFVNSFWSKDKSGMTQLLDYMKSTHDDLDIIYTIYTERSKLEHEFGEKLLSLSSVQEIDSAQFEKGGVPAAYHAISMELNKTATSHIELAQQLNQQVVDEFEQKLDEYKVLLEKWTKTLNELYAERQEKTMDLLKTRTKYLKEHEISKGQSTSTMDKLKGQYKSLVTEVDELSQEWNSIWKDACEVMEAMEEDRIEFLKSNVWEYANLASARLLIEDEWCETIRKQLEKCSAEQEIERCISIYGTGSKVPSTNDYVGEQMKEQKKKMAERSSAPNPPTKPTRRQDSKPKYQQEPPQPRSRSQQKSPLPNAEQDPPKSHSQEPPQPKPRSQEPPQPKPRSQEPPQPKPRSQEPPQPKPRSQEPPQPKPRSQPDTSSINQKEDISQTEPTFQHKNRSSSSSSEDEEYEKITNSSQRNSYTSEPTTHLPKKEEHEEDRMSHIRNKISDNIGSTAARGQIKRKPLNKSLMDQVTNQMAMAKQQREEESRSPSPQASVGTHKKTNSTGSLESLLKTFEVVNPVNQAPAIAAVSEEARSRRQPSEYKPDTGSVPTRRGGVNVTGRVLQEINDTSRHTVSENITHPVAAPKSPRPPAQQINNDADPRNQSYQPTAAHMTNVSQVPGPLYNQKQPSSNMMMQQTTDQNAMYSHTQPQYIGQQQYMGQQNIAQPQLGQNNIGQRSPMMQPQRSPMMQPQRSPMMQPQKSPMMAPLHSPMMQPTQLHQQQHYGTQRGGIPPPISIPVTNYGVTPQPSPGVTYTNNGGVSPGGVLPPPVVPYTHPAPQARPTQFSDGRPIMFWARAKYNYTASDVGEISFLPNTLIGILEADMTQQSWWFGSIWDEYRHTWSVAGSIPSNFMVNA